MFRRFSPYRALIALLTAAMWTLSAIAGPVHAAEEEFHHATQHQDDGGLTTAQDDSAPQDERSVHPEHAAHCHAGACHFHALSRASLEPASVLLFASKIIAPENGVVPQASLSSLFRPPRI